MARVRNDLFLCFGFWHLYHYGHIAVWHEFRATFLAPAFFALFPESKLLRRPKLTQSTTFFSWLRFAYPHFRDELAHQISVLKTQMIASDVTHVKLMSDKGEKKRNPFRHRYIHLINLQSLFEFCIPCLQDYGTALKSNNWDVFLESFRNIFALFVMSSGQGSIQYQNSFYCFSVFLKHCSDNALCLLPLLQHNHTLFSEESGEIALSVLSHGQPAGTQADIEQVRKQWQLIRSRHHPEADPTPRQKVSPSGSIFHYSRMSYVRISFFLFLFDSCSY